MAIRKGTTKDRRYAGALYTAILASGGEFCPTCHTYMQHSAPCPGWDAVMGAGTVTWATAWCPVCHEFTSACTCAEQLDEAA